MSVYEKPCRYRLKATSYVDGVMRVVPPETEVFVEYAGNPGLEMVPTDADGERRQAAYFKSKGITMQTAVARRDSLAGGEVEVFMPPPGSTPVPAPFTPPQPAAVVPIPDGWEKGNAGSIILLASKLGAPDTVNTAAASTEFIKAEIARRMGVPKAA
ncbi:MAG: hypothetical protein KF889_25415 [Alphaproteobacteria bacterium]|nr:hypothetical protein [Alphaproteobacteria bacterium]MCW5739667.1 hypothetical protein [Alphaproteobacteria bacterium]